MKVPQLSSEQKLVDISSAKHKNIFHTFSKQKHNSSTKRSGAGCSLNNEIKIFQPKKNNNVYNYTFSV